MRVLLVFLVVLAGCKQAPRPPQVFSGNTAPKNSCIAYSTTAGIEQMAYWRFADPDKSALNDEQDFDNGLYYGEPSFLQTGPPGALHSLSVLFDGTSAFAQVFDDPSLNVKSFSILFWFRVNGGTAIEQPILEKGGKYLGRGFSIHAHSGGNDKLSFNFWDASGTQSDGVEASYDPSQWNWAVWAYDGATATAYMNGTQVDQKGGLGYLASDRSLYIGRSSTNQDQYSYFSGQLSEMRLLDRALTPEEVKAAMTDCLN